MIEKEYPAEEAKVCDLCGRQIFRGCPCCEADWPEDQRVLYFHKNCRDLLLDYAARVLRGEPICSCSC